MIKDTTTFVTFIAEQDFILDDFFWTNEDEIWMNILASNSFYIGEFEKRKPECAITYSLSPIEKEEINFDEVLNFFED